MIPNDYINAVRKVLEHLEGTQMEAVESAASLVVDSLRNGGVLFCSGIGHGIDGDFINRAGGLAAVRHFTYGLNVNSPVSAHHASRVPDPETDLETVRLAVRASNLAKGDVMVIGSVSGRNRQPVELALACGEAGVKTIGLTSFAYTAKVTAAHPSGRKLKEACDVAIDIGAPYGDAAVDIPGYDHALLPVSGVAFSVAGWMIWGRVMERMAELGDPATVFMSINRPDGPDDYQAAIKRWNERGF
jgi:uncharacterized phosphosugar-binding protein